MSEQTGISWCDSSWNPWWGCTKVSPGCAHCYAETLAKRYGYDIWGPQVGRRLFGDQHWKEPLRWDRKARAAGVRRRVFCGSMCDVFEGNSMLDGQRERLWDLIRATPNLDWSLLSKRPENIERMIPPDFGLWPNVWLGTSVEDQKAADVRIPALLRIPARLRFLSVEPLLEPVRLVLWSIQGIHWVVIGGETGANARSMAPAWAAALVGECRDAAVPVFVKQDSGRIPGQQGRIPDEFWNLKEFPPCATEC